MNRKTFSLVLATALAFPAAAQQAEAPGTANAADPAPAALPAEPSATAPADAAADGNKKICIMHRPMGTNRAQRLCRTKAQIDAEREHAERQLKQEIERQRF